MEIFLFILGTLLVTAVLNVCEAFVLMKLWMWFIVPFFGFPPLTFLTALAFWLIIGFITGRGYIRISDDEPIRDLVGKMGYGFTDAGTVLIFAWILHQFIQT